MPTVVTVHIDEDKAVQMVDEAFPAFGRPYADEIAGRAQGLAPKDTGAGAASIRAYLVQYKGFNRYLVSWDEVHDYMGYQEFGTQNMAPNPFLRPSVSG
jgi:HK97 gp10 family phage protein